MLTNTPAFSGFAVDDIDEARRFYGETLGLNVSDGPMGVLSLELTGGATVMIYPKPDFKPATYTMLNFQVEDIDATVDGLAERGVSFKRYEGFDHDEKGIVRAPGPQIAWFEDPSGNVISVLQQP